MYLSHMLYTQLDAMKPERFLQSSDYSAKTHMDWVHFAVFIDYPTSHNASANQNAGKSIWVVAKTFARDHHLELLQYSLENQVPPGLTLP